MRDVWFSEKPGPVHRNCKCEAEQFRIADIDGREDIIVPPGGDLNANLRLSAMLGIALYSMLLVQTLGAFFFCCFLFSGFPDQIVTGQGTLQSPTWPLLLLAVLRSSGCWLLARLHTPAIAASSAARLLSMLNLAITLWPNMSMAASGKWPLRAHGTYAFFALANGCILLALLLPQARNFLFDASR